MVSGAAKAKHHAAVTHPLSQMDYKPTKPKEKLKGWFMEPVL